MERKKFTPAEDKAIMEFAETKGKAFKRTGNALWQLAERMQLTCHSWQSMRSRYILLSSQPAAKRPKTSGTPADKTPKIPLSP